MNIPIYIELEYNIVADDSFRSEAMNAAEIIEEDIKKYFAEYLKERVWTKNWDNKYLDNIQIKLYEDSK